jgi:hypothetical protein
MPFYHTAGVVESALEGQQNGAFPLESRGRPVSQHRPELVDGPCDRGEWCLEGDWNAVPTVDELHVFSRVRSGRFTARQLRSCSWAKHLQAGKVTVHRVNGIMCEELPSFGE